MSRILILWSTAWTNKDYEIVTEEESAKQWLTSCGRLKTNANTFLKRKVFVKRVISMHNCDWCIQSSHRRVQAVKRRKSVMNWIKLRKSRTPLQKHQRKTKPCCAFEKQPFASTAEVCNIPSKVRSTTRPICTVKSHSRALATCQLPIKIRQYTRTKCINIGNVRKRG